MMSCSNAPALEQKTDASVLPGCMTQGDNFEEARDNLIDAIELWLTVGLREGEEIPPVNDVKLVTAVEHLEEDFTPKRAVYA